MIVKSYGRLNLHVTNECVATHIHKMQAVKLPVTGELHRPPPSLLAERGVTRKQAA